MAEFKNDALMEWAEEAGFDLLVLRDKNILAQSRMAGRKLAVLFLGTPPLANAARGHWAILATIGRARPDEYEQMPKPFGASRPLTGLATPAMTDVTASRPNLRWLFGRDTAGDAGSASE